MQTWFASFCVSRRFLHTKLCRRQERCCAPVRECSCSRSQLRRSRINAALNPFLLNRRMHRGALLVRFSIIFAICICLGAGCESRNDAEKLASAGLATANGLAAYYDLLSEHLDAISQMEALSSSLRGLERDPQFDVLVLENQAALQRRARMSRQLAASYQSLKDLSGYDAAGSVTDSFDNLEKAITGFPPLKGLGASGAGAPVDTERLLSASAGMLASWKQSRDLKQATRVMTETLSAIVKLYADELPACQSISEEHVVKTGVIATELIAKKQVNAWPLLEQQLEDIGLKLVNPDGPPEDNDVNKALAQVVRARSAHLQRLANSAGESLLTALN